MSRTIYSTRVRQLFADLQPARCIEEQVIFALVETELRSLDSYEALPAGPDLAEDMMTRSAIREHIAAVNAYCVATRTFRSPVRQSRESGK